MTLIYLLTFLCFSTQSCHLRIEKFCTTFSMRCLLFLSTTLNRENNSVVVKEEDGHLALIPILGESFLPLRINGAVGFSLVASPRLGSFPPLAHWEFLFKYEQWTWSSIRILVLICLYLELHVCLFLTLNKPYILGMNTFWCSKAQYCVLLDSTWTTV